ncbi:MAG: DUF1232 domain-containing protein [Syntrophomonadaceae bacterium]|nr:DUF1232 domain-containing protein [Syntrophomonadaceae bacterium]
MYTSNNQAKDFNDAITQILCFIPNLFKMVYRLSQDMAVSVTDKALLLGTIAYVISPWDFLPDVIPGFGHLDDLTLIALVLRRLMDSVDHSVLESYWDGREDLLEVLEKVIRFATDLLPPHIHRKLIKRSLNNEQP